MDWEITARMALISRYIFRTTFSAFLLVLLSLTAMIWLTQALRDFDLVTNQGQTVLVFIGITGLIVPLLVLLIAPIALVIAVVHTLNKMASDTEIVVMHAAGMSPWILLRAFMIVALVVALLMTAISAYIAPKGLRMLRDRITAVRADVVSNIVRPGQFVPIAAGITIYNRERRLNGRLAGVMLDDKRNPKEHITLLAEEGELLDNDKGTFLVLEKGVVQRQQPSQHDPVMVAFDRYAFDLSQISSGPLAVKYSVRERYLWQLIWPDPTDTSFVNNPSQFRAELHDRLMVPFYPIAFVIIALAYLGMPRTNRQSRIILMFSVTLSVVAVRLFGHACSIIGLNVPWVLWLQAPAVFIASGLALMMIGRGVMFESPSFLVSWTAAFSQRIARCFKPLSQ